MLYNLFFLLTFFRRVAFAIEPKMIWQSLCQLKLQTRLTKWTIHYVARNRMHKQTYWIWKRHTSIQHGMLRNSINSCDSYTFHLRFLPNNITITYFECKLLEYCSWFMRGTHKDTYVIRICFENISSGVLYEIYIWFALICLKNLRFIYK